MVIDISAQAIESLLSRLRERALAPLSVMEPREWAETIMRMPDEHGATRPFSFRFAPYQLEPYQEIFNPRNQEVDMMMASRLGKSRISLTALGFVMHQRPCRIGVMWPTEGDAELWSKDDCMGELVNQTPALEELVDDSTGRRKSSNTILHKQFPGGLIQMIGANAPGRMRRMKARFLYGEEIDSIVEISSDEGDQLAIFKKRGSEFKDTIEIYCSYPSLKNRSRIEAKLLESDYREWFVTCLLCGGEPYVMHRKQLRYDAERPQDARLECPRCKGLLTDAQRYAMMMGGDPANPRFDLWRPTRPFRGKAGFHANALLWPHATDPVKFPGGALQLIAQQELDAEKSENPSRSLRVLVNTVDAETYEDEKEAKPEHSALFLRREEYDPGKMLPAGVLMLVFFVDVQSDRLELGIEGHGLRQQVWAIDYQIIKGSPLAPPDQGCWAELDRILTTSTWAHPSGKVMRLSGGLIDRGYKPDNVLAFTRPRANRRIFASRGSTNLAKPIVGRAARREGNPPAKVWELGTHEAKDIIYQRLALNNSAAAGFRHYPKLGQFSETFFKGLIAEDCTMKKASDGKYYKWFSCEEGVRNEPLDIAVGCMAMVKILRPNFDKLAKEFASEGGNPTPQKTNAPAPTTTTPENLAKKKSSWVEKKRMSIGRSFATGWNR